MKRTTLLLTHLATIAIGVSLGGLLTSPESMAPARPAKTADRHTIRPPELTELLSNDSNIKRPHPNPDPADDPKAALEDALRRTEWTSELDDALAPLFVTWLENDPAAAMAWLASDQSNQDCSHFISLAIDHIHQGDPLAFIASLDSQWGVKNRWNAVRGLAEWCGVNGQQHVPAVYDALQSNEHRSFLVVLSKQEPSPDFVRWLEESNFEDPIYLYHSVSYLLMEPEGTFRERPEGWQERTIRFLSQIEDLQCHAGYLREFESVSKHDAEDRERASHTLIRSSKLEEDLQSAAEWLQNPANSSRFPRADTSAGRNQALCDFLESSRRQPEGYAAWRDPVFASAMQDFALGQSTVEEAVRLYQERLSGIAPEIRQLLIKQALKSAIEFDPSAGLAAAVNILGAEQAANQCQLDNGGWLSRGRMLSGLMATDAWPDLVRKVGQEEAHDRISSAAYWGFQTDELAGLAWAKALPLPEQRHRALLAIARFLREDQRDSEAETLEREATK